MKRVFDLVMGIFWLISGFVNLALMIKHDAYLSIYYIVAPILVGGFWLLHRDSENRLDAFVSKKEKEAI